MTAPGRTTSSSAGRKREREGPSLNASRPRPGPTAATCGVVRTMRPQSLIAERNCVFTAAAYTRIKIQDRDREIIPVVSSGTVSPQEKALIKDTVDLPRVQRRSCGLQFH
ncbi:hypothetical protein PsYK624_016900 [Phanerochaete sordida]|uniref:Uncharacterized protein n=1 Tax=Phanerochaete sordida TaxID=48140 RepID=A0A9P3FZS2_9APHY|nr:hypothetical protein PsYK624_016900 [Phanerochaete sordida]